MPVRAAFTRLIAELAVNSLANGTVVIPKMRRDRFDELVELRVLLEGKATELASSRVTASELDEMEAVATRLTDAANHGSAYDYLELNQQFKFAIYDAARSPVLKDLIERLWLQIGPFMCFYTRDIKIQAETDEQWTALTALRIGDGYTARKAIEADIRAGGVFLVAVGEFDDTS